MAIAGRLHILLLHPTLLAASSDEAQCTEKSAAFDVSALPAAVHHYETNGYAVVRNALDASLMREVGQHVEHLTARYPSVPAEHLHHIFMKNDAFWIRLASDPRLLDLADAFAPFLDHSVALFSSHYFCKQPKNGKAVLWHQDGSYWPLRPMEVLTLYLAVDDADESNGGMRVVPGSHTAPLAALLNSSRDGSDVLGSATHADEDVTSSTPLELKAGDIEVHHPNLVHSSPANPSDRRRCALTLRYMAPTTEVLDATQPVMMMRGEAVATINRYHSWPPYRHGYDLPFIGAHAWNASRRTGSAESEAFLARTDYESVEAELVQEAEGFIAALGGR